MDCAAHGRCETAVLICGPVPAATCLVSGQLGNEPLVGAEHPAPAGRSLTLEGRWGEAASR